MIVAIKGQHNSGKTNIIEKIIKNFPKKSIVVIKLSGQNAIDIQEKDTYRYREAGAYASVIITITETVLFFQGSNLNQTISIVNRLQPDIVIIEGYKHIDEIHSDVLVDVEKKHDLNHIIQEIRTAIRKTHKHISVVVDGEEIFINNFVKEMLYSTINGMLSTLKNSDGNKVEIMLSR